MQRTERRVRRSQSIRPALSLQLQACAERSGVDAMILANADGLVVASSPWNEDACEHIAAHLGNVPSHQFRMETVSNRGLSARTVSARGFANGSERLVVCAVGTPTGNMVPEMYRVIGGVRRILGK